MKVAIDVSRMHELSRNRGVGVYVKNLFSAFKKYTDLDVELISKESDLKNYDLIHVPFFDFFIHTLKSNYLVPVIVTIHDLIPLMFPKYYPSGIKGKINWQLQKIAIIKAKSIIAVSETVKEDIERILNIKADKISAVYSAPSENFTKISRKNILDVVKEKYKLPKEFVLYIGNVNWNKNILNMTEAVIKANKNLVIIGSAFSDKTNLNHPEKKSLKIWLEKYGHNDKIKILGFLNEEDIIKIMNLAKCLIFPSFYEGFGLPILEAQACQLPVITSYVSATAEISGEGARLINPEDYQEIAKAIKEVFESKGLREKLVESGLKNLKRFSWKKTALDTMKVYEDAIK